MNRALKTQIKQTANLLYDMFERSGLTLDQSARFVERKKADSSLISFDLAYTFHTIRNDISAHLSCFPKKNLRLDEKFDRKKHTYNFANLPIAIEDAI